MSTVEKKGKMGEKEGKGRKGEKGEKMGSGLNDRKEKT
jgi:hypothetical protein